MKILNAFFIFLILIFIGLSCEEQPIDQMETEQAIAVDQNGQEVPAEVVAYFENLDWTVQPEVTIIDRDVNDRTVSCPSGSTCPNNMSIVFYALDTNSGLCLNSNVQGTGASHIEFATASGSSTVPINPVAGIGHSAFLPFNLVCDGSAIIAYLEKFPQAGTVCEETCFNWMIYGTTQGLIGSFLSMELEVDLASPENVILGDFSCCIDGTNSCVFTLIDFENFGEALCD